MPEKKQLAYRVSRDLDMGCGSVIVHACNRNQAMHAARHKMGWRNFGSSRDGGFRGYSVELVNAVADMEESNHGG